jgi:hypothetical protein
LSRQHLTIMTMQLSLSLVKLMWRRLDLLKHKAGLDGDLTKRVAGPVPKRPGWTSWAHLPIKLAPVFARVKPWLALRFFWSDACRSLASYFLVEKSFPMPALASKSWPQEPTLAGVLEIPRALLFWDSNALNPRPVIFATPPIKPKQDHKGGADCSSAGSVSFPGFEPAPGPSSCQTPHSNHGSDTMAKPSGSFWRQVADESLLALAIQRVTWETTASLDCRSRRKMGYLGPLAG